MGTAEFAVGLVGSRASRTRRINMRVLMSGVVVALSLGVWSCSGSDYGSGAAGNSGNPTAPEGAGIVTINVVAINGAQSFSPNPATVPSGQTVVWHNIDNTTHRVVLNDRSVDTGDLAPGAFSRPMTIAAGGGPYHCSIHPVMVGTIDPQTPPTPNAASSRPF
jgi:plastocyanin